MCLEYAPPGPVQCTPLPPVSTGTFNLFLGLVQAPARGQAQGLLRAAQGMRPTSLHTRTHTQHTAEHSMQESGWFLTEDRWCASALGKALTPWVREQPPPLEGALLPAPGPPTLSPLPTSGLRARAAEGTNHPGGDPEARGPRPA